MYTVCTTIIDQASHTASLEIFGLNMVWQVPGGANVIEAYNYNLIIQNVIEYGLSPCSMFKEKDNALNQG